jgi:ferredoxin
MIGLPERAELDQAAAAQEVGAAVSGTSADQPSNPYATLAANAFASPAGDDSGLLARILSDPRMQHHAGGLLSCLQCGICTSGCPAARFGDFSPREISRRALLGDPTLLTDDSVWLCCYCYTCQSRCPRGNSVAVIDRGVLRDRARGLAAPAPRRHRRRLG